MLAAVALAGLVLAATAQAKGPIQLCGPASCAPLGSETAPPIPLGAGPEMQLVPPVAPTGYYEIRFADVEGVLGYWVPAAGAVRLRDAAAPSGSPGGVRTRRAGRLRSSTVSSSRAPADRAPLSAAIRDGGRERDARLVLGRRRSPRPDPRRRRRAADA